MLNLYFIYFGLFLSIVRTKIEVSVQAVMRLNKLFNYIINKEKLTKHTIYTKNYNHSTIEHISIP